MQKPFPELGAMTLWSFDEAAPALPDSFFGWICPKSADPRVDGHVKQTFPGCFLYPIVDF